MLPGFRFLFAAVVLSMSAVIFGFGAAALFRTAHEEFANTPTWRPAPETRFAQAGETAQSAAPPVLAMLRVDDAPKETPRETLKEAPKEALKETLKAEPPVAASAAAPSAADQAAAAAAEPGKMAALQPADPAAPKPNSPAPDAVTSAPPAAETPQAAVTDAPAAPDAAKTAIVEPIPAPVAEAAPVVASAEPAPAAAGPANTPAIGPISTKIATLGGPPVAIEQPGAKAAGAKAEKKADSKADTTPVKKRHARRVRRRRIVRLTQPAAQQAQNPFGQPTVVTQAR